MAVHCFLLIPLYCLQRSVPLSVMHLHGDISFYVSNGLAFADGQYRYILLQPYNTNNRKFEVLADQLPQRIFATCDLVIQSKVQNMKFGGG